ncbi:MAG TPA: HD-GYP domain-containing protein [Phycisphaerae bacterium]|nr:HD-GYP domain-containing protein [Phycisphaerae bacterium]
MPVVLAAVWFNLRGALVTAGTVALLYVPHVALQWGGQRAENINQLGEIVTIALAATVAGILVSREKRALGELAAAYRGTARALVAALDAREHDTERHSERVCAYAVRLADELEVSPEQRRSIALGGLLHDIGKIGVPDSILLKPGRLTDDEWHFIRKHPELGKQILASVPFLQSAIDIVHCHHERFDGGGYPRSLAGEEIPLGARIFAVADVYDALTTARPYRRPDSCESARREIEKGIGSHFDPQVVAAFQRIPPAEWGRIRAEISSEQ